jgi:hypothetical protein
MLHKKHGVWERLEYEDIVILENSVGIDDWFRIKVLFYAKYEFE